MFRHRFDHEKNVDPANEPYRSSSPALHIRPVPATAHSKPYLRRREGCAVGRRIWSALAGVGPRVSPSLALERTSDEPTIPDPWRRGVCVAHEELTLELPHETLNIQADNEDSFQGPLPQLDLGL